MPPPRAVPKAPLIVETVNEWTGLYLGGGGGYGMWDHDIQGFFSGNLPQGIPVNGAGKGYFGTVTIGLDAQFGRRFLIGVFGDYDFTDMKGDVTIMQPVGYSLHERSKWAWAVGARVGYLVTPSVLSYVNGGYTEARFEQGDMVSALGGTPVPFAVPAHTYTGWFVGGGMEVMLDRGWFARTEYRFADYGAESIPLINVPGGTRSIYSIDSHRYVQTIRSELTYKFNWSDSIAALY
jgi:outer membrane immunogenic protein